MSDRTNHGSLASGSELDARLKRIDEPRWLASRYAQPEHRRGLVALFLIYNELARVRFAGEPMLARIRLQWWRESIEELQAGKPARRHELLIELGQLFPHGSPVVTTITALIDAFEQSLEDGGPDDGQQASGTLGPGAAMAETAGRLLNPLASADQLGILRRTGSLDERGAEHVPPTNMQLSDLARQLRKLDPVFWPAVAHLAAYNSEGVQVGQLHARWRVFWAILTRTI